jgi:hypothetical protein
MKLSRVWFTFFCAALSVVASATPSYAIRVWLDPVGPASAGGTPTVGNVPTVNLDAGQMGTLHVWAMPDGTRPPAQTMSSIAWNIETTNPAVATPLSHTVVNPANADSGDNRWSGTNNGFPGSGNNWVFNAFGANVGLLGIGNSNAANTTYAGDPEYHPATRSFYLGTLTFQAAAPGTTRLYFRTGNTKNTLTGGAAAPMQFGNTNVTYMDDPGPTGGLGDPISDPAMADAIIIVAGDGLPMVNATITAHALGDLTPGVALLNGVPQRTFVDVTPNVDAGRININNFHGEPSGDLTVFFDLVNDALAAQLVTDLNAVVGRQFTASVANFVGINPSGRNDGDIALTFAGRGGVGSSQFIDFDFDGALVQAVGIPEPSTYAIASLGLLALAVYNRRRRAA